MYNRFLEDELYHHGILGQKWGVRRFQNPDGTLTAAGKKRYLNDDGTLNKKGQKFNKKNPLNMIKTEPEPEVETPERIDILYKIPEEQRKRINAFTRYFADDIDMYYDGHENDEPDTFEKAHIDIANKNLKRMYKDNPGMELACMASISQAFDGYVDDHPTLSVFDKKTGMIKARNGYDSFDKSYDDLVEKYGDNNYFFIWGDMLEKKH